MIRKLDTKKGKTFSTWVRVHGERLYVVVRGVIDEEDDDAGSPAPMCLFRDTLLNGQIANYFSHFIAIICTCPHLTPNAFVSKEKKRASQAPRSKFIIWAWGHGVKSGQVPTAPEKGIGAQSSKPRKNQTDLIGYGCERASVSGEPILRKKWTAFFQNSSRSRSSTRNALEPSRERSKKSASEISTPSNLCSFLYSILQFRKREFSQIEDMQKRTQIQKPVWQHTGTSRSSQRETHALPRVAASWSRSCTSSSCTCRRGSLLMMVLRSLCHGGATSREVKLAEVRSLRRV